MSEIQSASASLEAIRHNFNIDWRAKKSNFNEQMAQFCMKDEMADVEFVFNRQNAITKIPAHTFALVVASEVFQKELTYGSANEVENGKRSKILQVIEVKDEKVEVDALKKTLLFIYNAYKNVELTGESALAVLYIAKKYMIKPLESLCVNFLMNNLNAANVFTILQFCIDCEADKRLMDDCKEFLRAKTEDAIKDASFLTISQKCLHLLLEQDFLNISETVLFEAVIHWSKLACAVAGQDTADGKNLRAKIGSAMCLIRFASMSMKEFREFVAPSGVLTLDEQRDVMFMIARVNPIGTPPGTIVTHPRGRNHYVTSLNVLKVCTQCQLSFLVSIKNFPSFVALKGQCDTRRIVLNGIEWFFRINLRRYSQIHQKYVIVDPASIDRPETLAAYIWAKRTDEKECAVDVSAKIKFKHAMDEAFSITHKFIFNAANGYKTNRGFSDLEEIDELLNDQNGYLLDKTLELLIDLSISECAQ